jgi:rod shape-determining protein MreD
MIVTRARLSLVMFVAFLVQVTLFVDVHPFGVAPELPLLVSLHCGRVAGAERGATAGFFMGLLYDLQHPSPFGLWALTCCVAAYFMGNLSENLHRPTGMLAALSTGIASTIGVAGFALGAAILGQPGFASTALVRISLLVGLCNLLLSPVVGRVIRWSYRPSGALRAAT